MSKRNKSKIVTPDESIAVWNVMVPTIISRKKSGPLCENLVVQWFGALNPHKSRRKKRWDHTQFLFEIEADDELIADLGSIKKLQVVFIGLAYKRPNSNDIVDIYDTVRDLTRDSTIVQFLDSKRTVEHIRFCDVPMLITRKVSCISYTREKVIHIAEYQNPEILKAEKAKIHNKSGYQ